MSGYRRDVHDICSLLRCYAASSGDFLPAFRGEKNSSRRRVVPKCREEIITIRRVTTQKNAVLIFLEFALYL